MRWYLLLGIASVALIMLGFKEARLAAAASSTPQQLSCQQLATNGPGDNAHVVLTDLLLCGGSYVYAERNGRWTEAWIPAVPLGGAYHQQLAALGPVAEVPPPANIRVIVKLPSVRGDSDVARFAAQEKLQGMVINDIESLGTEEKSILADGYPGVDFGRCWIVEQGRGPAGLGKIAGCIGGGLLLVVFLVWRVLRLRGRPEIQPERGAASPMASSARAGSSQSPAG